MSEKYTTTSDLLLDKSKEAFMMAIELYNKPTIRYRIEGFSMFICNAWELMLKAHIINTLGEDAIYFSDHPDRTLSLSDCVKKVFTNSKDPLRINLEKIADLRNISTHFITVEYEMVYVPLFQACVINFTEKMLEFHHFDMSTLIPQNFLTLSVSVKSLDETDFIGRYPEIITSRLLMIRDNFADIATHANDKFAININVNHYITKKKELADTVLHIAHDGEIPVEIIKELKDPNSVFPFTTKRCIEIICERLHRNNVILLYNGSPVKFNSFHFSNFVRHYGVKQQEKLCWTYNVGSSPSYSYSQQAIDFIYHELSSDPEMILNKIKKR